MTDAFHRLIMNVDVHSSGAYLDPEQRELRIFLNESVRSAFAKAEIVESAVRSPEDRGDGLLLVLDPSVPKARVLGPWIAQFHQEIKIRNARLRDPFRLRLGVHAGEVGEDRYGVVGQDVNVAFRLAGMTAARQVLDTDPSIHLVVAVSEPVYRSVVRHGGLFIDPSLYRQHRLDSREYSGPAWLCVPGRPGTAVPPAEVRSDSPASDRPHDRSVTIGGHGAVIDNSSIRDLHIGDRYDR
jgi:hypothetical protein